MAPRPPDGNGLTAPPVGAVGLTTAEAHRRLGIDGPNRLPEPPKPSRLRRFARQLVHFFALLLWAACLLAVLGGLPQLSVAIAIVILLNAVFAYSQEAKASRAAERLRDLLPQQVTARRDGVPAMIDAVDVVIGDLLLLESGDRVPADGTIVAASALQLDTSLLTGESATIRAEAGDDAHAGTFVVEGIADVLVRATGSSTRLAAIARLTSDTGPPASPLTIELRRVDTKNAMLTQPGQPDRRVVLSRRTVRECLAEELRRLDPDEIFAEALEAGSATRSRTKSRASA